MRRKKKINDQTTNENVAIINATNEIFNIHRRFVLKVALKVDDREKDENFTAVVIDEASEADETNEKKVNKTVVIDEAAKK